MYLPTVHSLVHFAAFPRLATAPRCRMNKFRQRPSVNQKLCYWFARHAAQIGVFGGYELQNAIICNLRVNASRIRTMTHRKFLFSLNIIQLIIEIKNSRAQIQFYTNCLSIDGIFSDETHAINFNTLPYLYI